MSSQTNVFLRGALGVTYARTALPIIFVMGLNGLLAVMDALFLGHFAGPDALAAVTLMFPLYMLVVALATLVSSGMSSILARRLGAGQVGHAQAVFAGAHGLALTMGLGLIALFATFGRPVAILVAGGSVALAEMGLIYLQITAVAAPLVFVLSINSDALRNEGRVGLMALISIFVSLCNMALNYLFIGVWDWGVAGSAYGTALAQALALCAVLSFRIWGDTPLRPSSVWRQNPLCGWRPMIALGAPQSLNFVGLALGSAAIIAALQWVETPNYDATVSAYGIFTRVITFTFLPLLGLAHAMQSITGNTFGAGNFARSDASLKTALGIALAYCVTIQVIVTLFASEIGAFFVDDPSVIAQLSRILPIMAVTFFLSGPLMIIAMHFQAIGDAPRAALLGLSKPYLFAIPLTFALATLIGEPGIWLAGPVAELLLLVLTVGVLARRAQQGGDRLGIFAARQAVLA